MDFKENHVINGKFYLGKKFGSGSFGEIYMGITTFPPFTL